jgi:hypothetical protein
MIASEESRELTFFDLNEEDIKKVSAIPVILNKFYKTVLQEGTDYEVIPGTPKPSLLKPGAELLQFLFKLTTKSEIVSKIEDVNPEKPFFMYVIRTTVFNQNGKELGSVEGSANVGETKHAFRKDKDGNKISTPPNEIFSLANTVLKMADKRSFVGAILKVTGASRIFTQDMEDENVAQSNGNRNGESSQTNQSQSNGKNGGWKEEKISTAQKERIEKDANDVEKRAFVKYFISISNKKDILELTKGEASKLIDAFKDFNYSKKDQGFRIFFDGYQEEVKK